ncbi:hypothetical protein [Mycobacterium sp. M23085]|uniref:hypothetical protein n=1 Tax=Mycobacterium sp. M23085 TaxID=3378087 RepID=UPI0038782074
MTFPGTAPAKRASPPPLPPFDARSVGGGDPIEHAARIQRAAADQYHTWRRSFSPNVHPEDRRDSANFFTVSDAAVALPQALDAAKAHAAEAQAKVFAAVGGQKVGDDVGSQLAADRYLCRVERILASLKGNTTKVVAAARAAIANADPAQLAVLTEELPSLLESLGAPTVWLNDALAQRIPGVDDLRADAALKGKRLAVLAANHNALVKAFAAGTPAPELVDPYAPGITARPYEGGTSSPVG